MSAAVLAAALGVSLAGPSGGSVTRAAAGEPVVRARWLMGTLCTVRAFGPAGGAGPALDAALDRIEALEQALTTWREDGELARVNEVCAAGRGAGGAGIAVSADLWNALGRARSWAERSGGAFDPTIGALADAWGLQSGGRPASTAERTAALAATGWRRFSLLADPPRVTCEPGVRFDLGAIGKGLALDEAAAVLRAHGVVAALFDFGGQLLATGPPPGRDGWPVSLASGAPEFALRDASVSVSGNAERGLPVTGGTRGHIIDPRSGRTVDGPLAVVVVARTAADADALSTALFVAGVEAGGRFVPAGVEFAFLYPGAAPRATPGLVPFLVPQALPGGRP